MSNLPPSRKPVKPRILLGRILATLRVATEMDQTTVARLILRHQTGDWGDLDQEDRAHNDLAADVGSARILSAYHTTNRKGEPTTLWIITEATRSSTTVLFPEEY